MASRPKPPIAAWIARERHRLGWKPVDLVTRLAGAGVEVSEQTIRVWESNAGRKPSAYNLETLERIFGSQAPAEREGAGDMTAVVAAIDRQTQAITELVTAIQFLLDIEVPPDSPEVAEARRIIREHVRGGLIPTLAEAEASGSAEGSRRARVHEDPAPLAPSPEPRPLGTGERRA